MDIEILTYCKTHQIPFEENVDLKKRTWIHRGRITKLWITLDSCEQVQVL